MQVVLSHPLAKLILILSVHAAFCHGLVPPQHNYVTQGKAT